MTAAVLRPLAGLVIVVAVVVGIGPEAVVDGVRSVSPAAVLAALAIGAVTTTAQAARWVLVARAVGLRIDLGGAVADYYRAQFLNSVLPAGVLGDVHRAVDHGRRAGDLGRGVRAVVLERVAGQVVVIVVGTVVLLVLPSPVRALLGGLAGTVPVLVGAAVAAAVVAGLVLAVPGARRWRRAAAQGLARALVETRTALLTRRTGPAVLALSLVATAGYLALLGVATVDVGVGAGAAQVAPLLVLGLLAMGLPVNVGGWGPREATLAVAFGAAGLGAAAGLSVAVAFGVLALVSTVPGAAVLLLRRSAESGRTRHSSPAGHLVRQ